MSDLAKDAQARADRAEAECREAAAALMGRGDAIDLFGGFVSDAWDLYQVLLLRIAAAGFRGREYRFLKRELFKAIVTGGDVARANQIVDALVRRNPLEQLSNDTTNRPEAAGRRRGTWR